VNNSPFLEGKSSIENAPTTRTRRDRSRASFSSRRPESSGFEQLIGMVGTDLAAFTQFLLPSDRDRTLVNMK